MGWKVKFKLKGPRITVPGIKVPEIKVPEIKKPEITVGGDVGRVGDALIKGATGTLEDLSAAPINAVNQLALVAGGKPLEEAIEDTLQGFLKPITSAAELEALATGIVKSAVLKLAKSVGGETAEDIMSDIMRVAITFPLEYRTAMLAAIDSYLETGQLNTLDPVALIIAAELTNARNILWPTSAPVPSRVIAALPQVLQRRASACRIMASADVPGNTTLPKIAIDHLAAASAVCVIDVIVFKQIPDVATEDDLHYWAHEIRHAEQYAGWGTTEFVRRYVANEWRRTDHGVNAIERDADLYACQFFPRATCHYIGSCPSLVDAPCPP